MGPALEILTAAVCLLGLGGLLWWLWGRLLRPIARQPVYVLLLGEGDGEGLEQTLREFMWLRGMGLLQAPILLVDDGLTPEGRELALALSRRWPNVRLRRWEQLNIHIP